MGPNPAANTNRDDNRQPSLTEEKISLNLKLEQLNAVINQASLDNQNPQLLNEQLSELSIKLEQHRLRFDQKVENAVDILGDDNVLKEERVEAVKNLLGVDLESVIINTLQGYNDEIRALSFLTLKGTENAECLWALCEGLKDNNWIVCKSCIAALQGTKDPNTLKYLMEGVINESYDYISNFFEKACALSLQGTDDKQCLEALRKGLKSSNSEVAIFCTIALKGTRDPACLKALCDELETGYYEVRDACAVALGGTRDSECLEVLCRGLNNDREPMRIACAKALQYNNDPKCIQALCEGLKDKEATVRQACVESLSGISDLRVRGALMQVLESEFAPDVRRAVAKALEVHG